ncbi:hypothetical protein An14g00730 [Aspergillus niger]|uniref:Uncharacterized protein n=2 Tax=Aspergillus niger TaxID=5061 RepID=A2R2H2_ASPNC|nr:hypothetical protein An14g00730 [Aspergillus niger]CAK41872.1 hypothetical protein An14g00730 [Aspergillus niger]
MGICTRLKTAYVLGCSATKDFVLHLAGWWARWIDQFYPPTSRVANDRSVVRLFVPAISLETFIRASTTVSSYRGIALENPCHTLQPWYATTIRK